MRLPILKGDEVVKALKKAGFGSLRQRGSHVYLKHPDGRSTVVPIHKGKDIDRGLFSKILRDVEVGGEDFVRLL